MGGMQFPALTYAEWSWDGRNRFDSDGNRFFGVKWDKFRSGADYLELIGWAKEEYVRRIVASVNATAGISTKALEAGVIAELVEAALVAAEELTFFVEFSRRQCEFEGDADAGLAAANSLLATLARIKGEA